MEDTFTVTLPKSASPALLAQLRDEVAALDGVEESGELTTRGLDPVSIGVWVKLVSDSVGLTDKLIEAVRKVFGIVRRQGIKGAKVTVGAAVIELGEMSLEEFEQTMARLKRAAA